MSTEPTPINVNVNDQINGLMTWNATAQIWTTTVTDNTLSQSLSIDDPNFLGTNNLKATCALEGKGVEGNSNIPTITTFTNIQFTDINNQPVEFNWNPWFDPNDYSFFQGLFVDTSSQSQVTLYTNYQYTITPSAGSGGSISPGDPTQVLANANQTFTITPAAGNAIADVQIDPGTPQFYDAGAVSSYKFVNVTANHTISATFTPETYTITPSASGWSCPHQHRSLFNGNKIRHLPLPQLRLCYWRCSDWSGNPSVLRRWCWEHLHIQQRDIKSDHFCHFRTNPYGLELVNGRLD